jgi:hypothetical protein
MRQVGLADDPFFVKARAFRITPFRLKTTVEALLPAPAPQ